MRARTEFRDGFIYDIRARELIAKTIYIYIYRNNNARVFFITDIAVFRLKTETRAENCTENDLSCRRPTAPTRRSSETRWR